MKDLKTYFEFNFEPKRGKLGWTTFELGATTVSDVRGDSLSTYELLPVVWTKRLIDAAREKTRFLETVRQEVVPENADQVIIPIRKKYLAASSWSSAGEEPTSITATDINTPDGVQLKPTDYNYRVDLSYKAVRTNAINMVQFARDEITRFYDVLVDQKIRDNTMGDANSTENNLTAAPTPMSDSANGAQYIFGGDATDADDSLETGDILTTDMIRKAIRLLSSEIGWYWSSNTFTKSSTSKNPWEPTAAEPFVLFIAPEQREALQGDSQFTNAAEYGSNEVVLTGEIGQYLGVKVICTSKCTSFADNDYIYGDGTTNPKMNVDGHICMLAKAFRYGAMAWGNKPTVKVFDYPSTSQVRILLTLAMAAKEVHSDAIVRLIVSDQ